MSKLYTCKCCGYRTLTEEPPGTYEICHICFWEEDHVQGHNPFFGGGANTPSLIEAQKNFLDFGACERAFLEYVRKPTNRDIKDEEWIFLAGV